LINYSWPGNVRELENMIERLVVMADEDTIRVEHLPISLREKEIQAVKVPRTKEELKRLKKEVRKKAVVQIEKRFILEALKRNNWNVTKAAKDVGMQRQNFQALMRKHKISRPNKKNIH